MHAVSRSVGARQCALALVLPLTLAACDGSAGPGSRELRDDLATQLPSFLEPASFDLEARQNTGTETEPAWASRFRAELRLREDTYREVRREGDVLFVRRVAASGDERLVYGKALAALTGGSWTSEVALDGDPTGELGRPLSAFDAPRVIVIGSDEERAYQLERRNELFTRGSFAGSATANGGVTYPLEIRFTGLDPATMRVRGEVKWPTLGGATKRFEGTLSGRSVTARETEWVVRGDGTALFGLEYRIEVGPTLDELTGSWSGQGYDGRITLSAG